MTEMQKENIAEIAKKFGFTLVVLFGSQVRGKTHRTSDVDIGFLSDKTMSLREIADIEFEMAQKLSIPTIELVHLGGMASLFLRQVTNEGIVLYEDKPGAFTSFASYVFRRFIEEKPLRNFKEQSLRVFSSTV